MSKIKTGHVKQLIKNYVDTKIGKVIGPSETRAVWFSRDDIMEALNSPVHGIIPNGLRFYFGAYESFKTGRPPKYKDDQNKITLAIVPTTGRLDNAGNVIMHPYRDYPEEVLPFDLLDDPGAKPGYEKDVQFLAEVNDGQICPPPPVLS